MTDTPDHPPGEHDFAAQHLPAREPGHSHLAHWPPPQRGHEVKHAIAKHHPAGEQAEHEKKPHGWGLTRSVFKDDSD